MRSDLAGLALIVLVGCAQHAGAEPPRRAPSPKPAPREAVPASVVVEGTIAGRDAAEILRRAALMRALSRTKSDETWEAAQELIAVWEDAEGRPEEAALIDLIDRHLLAKTEPDRDSVTTELRVDLVRAWLDRGDRERARTQALVVRDNTSMVSAEEEAEILLGVGLPMLDEETAELVEGEAETRIRALVAARWGDAREAEAVVADLEPDDRCRVATTLATRRRREGDPAAERWRRQAEAALREISTETRDAFVACAADLGRELARIGDRAGAARVFGRADGREVAHVCHLLYAVADRVDPTLLDGPLLAGARSSSSNPSVTWFGCSSLLAEVAARRGERRVSQHMWTRAQGDYDGWEEEKGFDRLWMAGIRLGRVDPLEPHGLANEAFRQVALARIYDEQPDTRVDAARLAAALTVAPEEAGDDTPEEDATEADDTDPEVD